MATPCEDVTTKNLIRKYRKKLRQIEHLERLNRELSDDELIKVESKYVFRDKLQNILAQQEEENEKEEEEPVVEDGRGSSFDYDVQVDNNSAPVDTDGDFAVQQEKEEGDSELKPHALKSTPEMPQYGRDTNKDAVSKLPDVKHQQSRSAGDSFRKQEKTKPPRPSFASSQFKVTSLEGHNEWITAVVLYKDVLITASQDTTVKTWDLLTGGEMKNFGGHKNSATCLVVLDVPEEPRSELFQAEEPLVVSGSFDCTLKIWSLYSGQLLKSIYTYNPITRISYAPNHSVLVVGSDTGKLELWDLDTGEQRFSLHAYDASVTGIKVDGNSLQSCASDGIIKVHSISDDLKLSCVFESENVKSTTGSFLTARHVRSLELCERGILIGDDARNIKVLNWRKNEANKVPNHHSEFSSTDAICCHGDFVISSGYDLDQGLGFLNVRCSHTLAYLATLDDKETERIVCVDFCHLQNGNMLLVTGGSELKRWEVLKQTPKVQGEDIFEAEFRRALARDPIDSEDEDDETGDDDEDDDEDPDSIPTRQEGSSQQETGAGSWMSWCSVL